LGERVNSSDGDDDGSLEYSCHEQPAHNNNNYYIFERRCTSSTGKTIIIDYYFGILFTILCLWP
jgi:hypothetical protein